MHLIMSEKIGHLKKTDVLHEIIARSSNRSRLSHKLNRLYSCYLLLYIGKQIVCIASYKKLILLRFLASMNHINLPKFYSYPGLLPSQFVAHSYLILLNNRLLKKQMDISHIYIYMTFEKNLKMVLGRLYAYILEKKIIESMEQVKGIISSPKVESIICFFESVPTETTIP